MKSLELQVISSILADLVTKMTGSRFLVASLMPAWLVASVINVSGTHQWAWNEDERSRALVRKQIMIRNLSSQSIVSISNWLSIWLRNYQLNSTDEFVATHLFFKGRIGCRYDIPIPAKAVITEMIFQLKVLEVAGAIGARGARGGVVLGALWNQGWWSSPLSVSTCWEGQYPKVSLKGQAKNVWQTMLRLADVISILAQWLVIRLGMIHHDGCLQGGAPPVINGL